VLGKKTKFQQFHSSARAIHTKATLTEFEHHLTNIHITCRDLTMRYPVCVCAWQVDGLDSSEEKDGSANQGLQALHGETWHQEFLFKHLTHVQQKLHIEVQVFTIFVNSHGHC